MTIDNLRRLYNAQPFQPFELRLADGNRVTVASREFIASAPSGRTLVVWDVDDDMHIIDPLLIAEAILRPAGNGTRKRRKSG